ncbi:MAG: hypothetical protein ABIP94_14710, partial [Planctomycetota bacterium]
HRRGSDWLIESQCPDGRSFWFRCVELMGAAPRALATDCAAVDPDVLRFVGAGRSIDGTELPRPDPVAMASGRRADQLPCFRADKGIALLHWEAGTEGDDFVLAPLSPLSARSALEVPGDLIVVPGHLWIEPGSVPLRLRLPRDLVIVTQGNLYIGRSIVVEGEGRLCLATVAPAGAMAFADRDGNGRWSPGDAVRPAGDFAGPMEGGGGVYLGLPGSRGSIHLDGALVPRGEVHLRVDTTVSGPFVVPFGVTATTTQSVRLTAAGSWAFRVERERVPGFLTSGVRRPGILVFEPRIPAALPHQGLYQPAPAR